MVNSELKGTEKLNPENQQGQLLRRGAGGSVPQSTKPKSGRGRQGADC